MKRLGVTAALLVLLLASATAQARHNTTLHRGDRGAAVCGLQWLLSGGKPSVYRGLRVYPAKLIPRRPARCLFGKRTARTLVRAKFLLGWPRGELKPTAGRDFREIVTGQRSRPLGYIVRATRRKAASVARRVAAREKARRAAQGTRAARMLALAARECCGFRETWGPNRGPRVDVYTAVTGTRGLAWCAAFVQWLRRQVGLPVFGFPAPAAVRSIANAAQARGLLRTTPRPGRWVLFLDRRGNDARNHMGIVERLAPGGIFTIEGNTSDGVFRRLHPYSNFRPKVYVVQPGTEGTPV